MINNKKKITPVDLEKISIFLNKYGKLDIFENVSNTLDLIIEDQKVTTSELTSTDILSKEDLILDVLDLTTSLRVRVYPKQIMKICKMLYSKLDDNYVSKTLYQIKIKKCGYRESMQGQYMVWSKDGASYVNVKKLTEGNFSKLSDSNSHASLVKTKKRERVIFLEPLEKNAERQTKTYLANKYHPETWVVTFKNVQKDVWLFNWQESHDHIRTYYSRELNVEFFDVRCRRLKNYNTIYR